MKKLLLTGLMLIAGLTAAAYVIEWDRIKYWTGEGENRAALVLQFKTEEGRTNPGAIVWGYRWRSGQNPSGEQMLTDIASNSKDLGILKQFTGIYGSTFDGAGYAPDARLLLGTLSYDFESAAQDGRISFGFYEPNTTMSQTSAPGVEAEDMVAEAIADARLTGVIEHPLNQKTFGYPAYDYDWWQLDKAGLKNPDYYWNSGWYRGYWSYWTGTGELDELGYSGLGMTSVKLQDGDINAWKYLPIDGDNNIITPDATSGATEQWLAPNYDHFSTSGATIVDDDAAKTVEVYRMDGTHLLTVPNGACPRLAPGVYVVRRGKTATKMLIK